MPAIRPFIQWLAFAAAIVLACVSPNARAQAPHANPRVTMAYREAVLYRGPGDSYQQIGILNAGVEVTITERNRIGNWLHVMRSNARNATLIDGWVLTGYLTLNPELKFSEIPVNLSLADADPSNVRVDVLTALYAAPVISEISPAMQDVFEEGQALGNHANVVTKVGDSLSADGLYLSLMLQEEPVLGPYDYLAEAMDFFGKDVVIVSVAARVGMTSYVVLDPMWADPERCVPNETPLDCEYRNTRPAVSMIMFGPNDVLHITDEVFREQMQLIIEQTLEQGIIPVLSTFSYHPDSPMWWSSVNFNLALIDLAAEYEVPLINLWSAARPLPDYGLEGDYVHMTHSGFRYLKFDTGHESWYGVPLRNLLSIRMLDELRRTLHMDEGIEATPEATPEATEQATTEPTAGATEEEQD